MSKLQALIEQEELPASFTESVLPIYQQLAVYLTQKSTDKNHQAAIQTEHRLETTDAKNQSPLLVAINGAQGTGKSTLALFLQALLKQAGFSCAVLSIDDFYYSHEKRQVLANTIHPLLATRGVPGTHDLELAHHLLNQLSNATANSNTALPSFNKASDDRRPENQWPVFTGKPDIIIVEGWCMCAKPMPETKLQQNTNSLERNEDPEMVWRLHINQQLQTNYQQFFARFEQLLMLKAPSFEAISRWRSEQESKLAKKMQNTSESGESSSQTPKNGASFAPNKGIMNQDALVRFMMHYERLTRCMLEEMPSRADVLMELREDHRINEVIYRTQ